MDLLINLIPLLAIIVLLILKQHMLVAGFVGGVLAMIIGGFGLEVLQPAFGKGIGTTLGYITPVLYAAAAMMVSKAGSVASIVKLAQKSFKDKIYLLAAILVLIQALATFMAGTAAGNTMVIAPLVFLTIGAIPEVIGAMAVVGAVGFTTSPASTETAMAADAAGMELQLFANNLMPYWFLFIILAMGIAIYGVKKRGVLIEENTNEESEYDKMTNAQLWKRSIPAIVLLLAVVLGSQVNKLVGVTLFSPAVSVILTTIAVFLFTDFNLTKTMETLIDGSQFILTTLFGVGIFLSFIDLISQLGLFEQLASLVSTVPQNLVVPAALIMAFLIAIPSGAFAAGVLALILPTMALLGMPPMAMGFVGIATGLGTQISPVQINVAALSSGFKKDIMAICKNNLPFSVGGLALLIVLSFIFI